MSRMPKAFMLCAVLVMTACGTAQYDWNKALAANTSGAYQSFVQHHPTDERADDARGRILALKDDRAWALARATGTIAAYQRYLQNESGGIHAPDAQYYITTLQRATASR